MIENNTILHSRCTIWMERILNEFDFIADRITGLPEFVAAYNYLSPNALETFKNFGGTENQIDWGYVDVGPYPIILSICSKKPGFSNVIVHESAHIIDVSLRPELFGQDGKRALDWDANYRKEKFAMLCERVVIRKQRPKFYKDGSPWYDEIMPYPYNLIIAQYGNMNNEQIRDAIKEELENYENTLA